MKRFLFLIALLIFFGCNAYATVGNDTRTATLGDKDNSNVYRVATYRDSNNDGYVVYANDTGIIYPYLESTTNLTLGYYQSGLIFTVFPAQNNTQFTLPTCSTPGLDFYLVSGTNASTWKVEIQNTDIINFTGETVGKGISNTSAAQGDQIELFCGVTNNWVVKDKIGTWIAGS